MTPEQKQQRIAAIKARSHSGYIGLPKHQVYDDVADLLSLVSQEAGGEAAIRLLAAERVANAARNFCEEVQEDAEGVPQPQLADLNAALDAWEAYPDAQESFDDDQPVLAALASLIEDEHATDHQRRVGRLALDALKNHEDEFDKELRRWQDGIRDELLRLGAPDWKVDGGAGAESGDPLDFTLSEVMQGCGWFIDKAENAVTSMRSRCIEKVKSIRDEWKKQHAKTGDTVKRLMLEGDMRVAGEIIAELESVTIQKEE